MSRHLFNRNFSLMVIGQVVTVMGSSLLRFALSLYVLDTTGRADLFAALFAISSIPILLAPLGGAISDRFNRQRLMVLYDALCCIITIAFLFILFSGNASVFAVGTVMVLLGIIGAMETPNGTACVPLLVSENKLESANGAIQAVQSLSAMIAPVLGGILYGAFGIRLLVAVSGAAFGLAAAMELFIRIPFVKRTQTGKTIPTLFTDMKGGFRYVWNESFIRKMIFIAALLNLVLTPCILVASPIVLRVTMHSSDAMYGAAMGLINAASILGAVTVGVFSKKMKVRTMWGWLLGIALMFVPLAIFVMPIALGTGVWLPYIGFMLCLFIMVAVTTILSIFIIVRTQKKTPNEHLGKVMAIAQAAAQCAAPIGQFLYGVAFQRFQNAAYLPLLLAGGLILGIAFISKAILNKEESGLQEERLSDTNDSASIQNKTAP